MTKALCLLLLALCVLPLASCELDSTYKFTNNSSQSITISPDAGQDWVTTLIAPGNSVTISESAIQFNYYPSSNISVDKSTPGLAVFTDS
jgi:hypothetical protein